MADRSRRCHGRQQPLAVTTLLTSPKQALTGGQTDPESLQPKRTQNNIEFNRTRNRLCENTMLTKKIRLLRLRAKKAKNDPGTFTAFFCGFDWLRSARFGLRSGAFGYYVDLS